MHEVARELVRREIVRVERDILGLNVKRKALREQITNIAAELDGLEDDRTKLLGILEMDRETPGK